MVASVQETSEVPDSPLVLHSEPWIGAINLDKVHLSFMSSSKELGHQEEGSYRLAAGRFYFR
jgi:hypothetical protein